MIDQTRCLLCCRAYGGKKVLSVKIINVNLVNIEKSHLKIEADEKISN